MSTFITRECTTDILDRVFDALYNLQQTHNKYPYKSTKRLAFSATFYRFPALFAYDAVIFSQPRSPRQPPATHSPSPLHSPPPNSPAPGSGQTSTSRGTCPGACSPPARSPPCRARASRRCPCRPGSPGRSRGCRRRRPARWGLRGLGWGLVREVWASKGGVEWDG